MARANVLPRPQAQADMLHRLPSRHVLRGLGNLLANETRAWWSTRRWLVHAAVWVVIINGFTGLLAWAETRDGIARAEVYAEAIQTFCIVGGIAGALGVVATVQGAVVGEKQSGTAAWLMSKPASRNAFVLAKLLAHGGAFLVLALMVPALVLCLQSLVGGRRLPLLMPLVGGLAVLALHLGFYLTLTIMLGAVLDSRGPIVGIGVGLIIAGQSLPNLLPWLGMVFPWRLPAAAAGLMLGAPLSGERLLALGVTAAWTVLFVAVALWRFAREEL